MTHGLKDSELKKMKKDDQEVIKEMKKEENKLDLVLSASPHIRDTSNVRKIMWRVAAALAPASMGGVYFFGLQALWVMIAAICSAIITEWACQKALGKPVTLDDGTAVVTGLLLALVIPPSVPLWIPVIGSAFAIAVAKHAFGGIGCNIFNPALAGRAFLTASWPILMTTWLLPDGTTGATPLGIIKVKGVEALHNTFSGSNMYMDLFTGNIGGCIGETSAIMLLLGAGYLFYKKIIDWRIPLSYMGTVAILTFVMGQDVLFHLLTGGLIIGAFFMATDYVTSPVTRNGRIIFGIGIGLLTVIIRVYGGLPEGVSYSILMMNAFVPLIDRHTKHIPFGGSRKKFFSKKK